MSNYDQVIGNAAGKVGFLKIQEDATGSATQRFGIYLESVEAKANRLTQSWEKLVQLIGNSDAIKSAYDVGIGLIDALDGIIGYVDELPEPLRMVVDILELLVIDMIALNVEVSKTFLIKTLPGILGSIIPMLTGLTGATVKQTIAQLALNAAQGLFVIALTTMVYAGTKAYELSQELEKRNKEVEASFSNMFKSLQQEGKQAGDLVNAYANSIKAMRAARESASGMDAFGWAFVSDTDIAKKGLVELNIALQKSSTNYQEYKDQIISAANEVGLSISENGDLIGKNMYGMTIVLAEHFVAEMSVIKDQSLLDGKEIRDGIVSPMVEGIEQLNKAYSTLASTLSLLNKDISNLTKISSSALEGKLEFTDIVDLMNTYPDLISALKVEGGQVVLDTDAVKQYNLSKIDQAIVAREAAGATEQETAILKNYRDQVARATPDNKEYAHSFQDILNATNKLMAIQSKPLTATTGSTTDIDLADYSEVNLEFAKIGKQLTELNYLNEQGVISSNEYFEQLKVELESIDMTKTFGDNKEAAETFFSGLVYNASESLQQINTMFDSGEIGIVDYMGELTKLTDVFGVINNMMAGYGDESAEDSAERIKNTENLTAANEKLKNMQELASSVDIARGKILDETIQVGTKDYEEQTRIVADAAAQSGEVFTDVQGNILKTSDDIYNYMSQSTGNFEIVAQQTAISVQNVIRDVMANIGNMLHSLAETVRNFDLKININPKQTGEKFDLSANVFGKNINVLSMNGVEIDFSGSDVGGQIANFIEGIGQGATELSTTFTLNANVFGLEKFNQITGTAGKASSAVKDLADSTKDVGDAAKESLDALGDLLKITISMIKQQKEAERDALKTELSDFKKLIDTQKDYIDNLKEEADFQDELADKNKSLATIQQELIDLAMDDSEEAKAKRLALQDEEAKKKEEIAKYQRDHQYSEEKEALDQDYKNFETVIDAKVRVIEEYLEKSGQIANDAMDMINNKSSAFYASLIEWNRVYGDGIDATVKEAWDSTYAVLEKYKNLNDQIDYQYASLKLLEVIENAKNAAKEIANTITAISNLDTSLANTTSNVGQQEINYGLDLNGNGIIGKHTGVKSGVVGGQFAMKSNEELAKLLDGEIVVNPQQMNTFMTKTLPSMMGQAATNIANAATNIGKVMEITVQGNLDSSVLPDIEKIANKVVGKLNSALGSRGIVRTAKPFSV